MFQNNRAHVYCVYCVFTPLVACWRLHSASVWLVGRKPRPPPSFTVPDLPHGRTELARKCHGSSQGSRLPSESQQEWHEKRRRWAKALSTRGCLCSYLYSHDHNHGKRQSSDTLKDKLGRRRAQTPGSSCIFMADREPEIDASLVTLSLTSHVHWH